MANQEPGRYQPLDFSPDPRRRIGMALLVTGLGLLVALVITVYMAIAHWWYAAEGTETFDYWFDIVVVIALILGLGTVFAGAILIGASKVIPRK